MVSSFGLPCESSASKIHTHHLPPWILGTLGPWSRSLRETVFFLPSHSMLALLDFFQGQIQVCRSQRDVRKPGNGKHCFVNWGLIIVIIEICSSRLYFLKPNEHKWGISVAASTCWATRELTWLTWSPSSEVLPGGGKTCVIPGPTKSRGTVPQWPKRLACNGER